MKLTGWQKILYASGSLGVALSYQAFGTYIQFLYIDILGLKASLVGVGWSLYGIWNALNDPLAGYFSDRTRSRWGRRTPWIAGAFIPLGLFFYLLWVPPAPLLRSGRTPLFVWFMAMILVFDLLWTIVVMNWSALFPEMIPEPRERAADPGGRRLERERKHGAPARHDHDGRVRRCAARHPRTAGSGGRSAARARARARSIVAEPPVPVVSGGQPAQGVRLQPAHGLRAVLGEVRAADSRAGHGVRCRARARHAELTAAGRGLRDGAACAAGVDDARVALRRAPRLAGRAGRLRARDARRVPGPRLPGGDGGDVGRRALPRRTAGHS
ncbi:MAG: MFS transporter, partial [Candidatus Eisenbacteria bacterium]